VLEGGAGKLGSPLEALEMYAEARLHRGEVAELVHRMRAGYDAPFSWDDIAGRLGISRQSAWKKYRSAEEGVVRLRQRPGPCRQGDVVEFVFTVNDSYVRGGELTVPVCFNVLFDERLPGDGPSWSASIRSGETRDPVKFRCGHTRDRRYYQVRVPIDVRSWLGLRSKQVVDVRIALLGSLVVELS
jgi:hypothetical protein